MSTCHTWATDSHIRHPWFHPVIMKRKHSPSPSSTTHNSPSATNDDDDDDDDSSHPPLKRRRCSTLEHGLAHLTLSNTFPAGTYGPGSPAASSYSSSSLPLVQEMFSPENVPMDADVPAPPLVPEIVFPSSVEEPSIPEVKMKTSSWYEPEPDRIVITDLDSFSKEDEDDEAGMPSVTIHPGYLERMRAQDPFDPLVASAASTALVLFKSLPLPMREEETRMKVSRMSARRTDERSGETADETADEDAMDVEP